MKFDSAYLATQDIFNKIVAELKDIYGQAYNSLIENMPETCSESIKMKKRLETGKITQEEYQEWLTEKLLIGKYQRKRLDNLSEILTETDLNATDITNRNLPEIYCLNNNYTVSRIGEHYKIDINFLIFNENAVRLLIQENPDLLPKTKIHDRRYNLKKINSAIALGIVNGESIDEIAKRVAKIANTNRTSATRTAATMVTTAQNVGRMHGYKRCQQMGMTIKHSWLSATDKHTRASHMAINGQIAAIGEKFSNGLEYPGDPNGNPAEVYNCRCCTVAVFDDI
ncbi:MAG: phage head morphogenesis protein [Prevotella sp.]|nr:phage head morphogenesis protein [Alistipes senegalensis]MCM1357146.1 phage head morphogenesis protein [Prevotella sp.]MCM1472657.1 phage head morphogenesis protein [Muribaculaceae bacterium]